MNKITHFDSIIDLNQRIITPLIRTHDILENCLNLLLIINIEIRLVEMPMFCLGAVVTG